MTNAARCFGPFRADNGSRTLWRDGVVVPLTPTEFTILWELVQAGGAAVATAQLEQAVWNGAPVGLSTLPRHIANLRQKLSGPDGAQYIATASRVGYRLALPVEEPLTSAPVIPPQPKSWPRSRAAHVLYAAIAAGLVAWLAALTFPRTKPKQWCSQTPLTQDAYQKGPPLLSDGKRIYFVTYEGTSQFTMSAPLSGAQPPARLRLPLEGGLVQAVSADGRSFLVQPPPGKRRAGQLWIWMPGGEPRLLGDADGGGEWSPDEKAVALATRDDLRLVTVDGPGGTSEVRANGQTGTTCWPKWSPDGQRIRFTINNPARDTSSLFEVTLSDTKVTKLSLLSQGQPQSLRGAWSPDGKYYYYEAGTAGHHDVWVMLDGGRPGSAPPRPSA